MTPLRDCHLQTHQILREHTGFLREPTFCGQTMYVTWPQEELCAMLGQRVRDPLSFLYPSPSGADTDRVVSSLLSPLRQKKQKRWEEAVNPINFSHSSRKAWRTINKLTGRSGCSFHQCSISGKLHRLATCEERGKQDWGSQVHQAGQQGAVRPMEDPNTRGSQYL